MQVNSGLCQTQAEQHPVRHSLINTQDYFMDSSIENSLILTMLRDQNLVLRELGNNVTRCDEAIHTTQMRLFGNGQPGFTQLLNKRCDDLEAANIKLKGDLEHYKKRAAVSRAYAIGYTACIGTFITFGLAWLAKRLGFTL
jgi:hypothetical protein